MPQDKRKSKRHFSLEKPVERRFEIEKDDVDNSSSVNPLTTNGSTTQQPSGQGSTPSPNPNADPMPAGGTNGKTKWIAVAFAAGLIGGGAYFLWPNIDDNNQPKVAQIDVNGDGVVDINDDPTQDTNGDGVIDIYDAAKDTNGDGVVDAADAAVADSNGDKIIDEKDKSSGDMLFEKPFNPEVDQIAKVDVNGDGVVDVKDNPTKDTNGDGIINFYDAVKDTNGDGTIDAADAAVADSNGDGVIDSKDKSSDEMLKEKNVAQDNVDNPTTDNNDNASGVSSNTGENGKVASNTGNNINDASEASSTTSGDNNGPGATSTAQGSKTGNTIMNANNQKQIEVSTNQTSPGTKSSNATTSNSERQITPKSNKLITLDENPNLSLSIKELAKRAIRGDYGNNPDRKRILGKSYKKVQKEINKIYRKRYYRHKYRRNYRHK